MMTKQFIQIGLIFVLLPCISWAESPCPNPDRIIFDGTNWKVPTGWHVLGPAKFGKVVGFAHATWVQTQSIPLEGVLSCNYHVEDTEHYLIISDLKKRDFPDNEEHWSHAPLRDRATILFTCYEKHNDCF